MKAMLLVGSAVLLAAACGPAKTLEQVGETKNVSNAATYGPNFPVLAAGSGDWGVSWNDVRTGSNTNDRVFFARVDAAGVPGSPVELSEGADPRVAAAGENYGVTWLKWAPGSADPDVHFVEVTKAGPGTPVVVAKGPREHEVVRVADKWGFIVTSTCTDDPCLVFILGAGAGTEIARGKADEPWAAGEIHAVFDGSNVWVTWRLDATGKVYLRRLSADGTPAGNVTTVAESGMAPRIALGKGEVSVTYLVGTRPETMLHRFGVDGSDRGASPLAVDNQGAETDARITWTSRGWVHAWHSKGWIKLRSYEANGAPRPGPIEPRNLGGIGAASIGLAALGTDVGLTFGDQEGLKVGQIFFARFTTF